MTEGWIKLWREMADKGWYTRPGYSQLFIHLLLKASHTGYETWFDGQTIELKEGQLVTGRKKLSKETGIKETKIERILKFFENEQQIGQVSCSTSRLITILNWSKFQGSNNETDSEETARCSEETLNKKVKNDKKEKNISPLNFSFDDFWNLYDKKVTGKGGLPAMQKKWASLKDDERTAIMVYIPRYIKHQPDKQYRKNPEGFLNQRAWENEIVGEVKQPQTNFKYSIDPELNKW